MKFDPLSAYYVPVDPDGCVIFWLMSSRRIVAIRSLFREPFKDVEGKTWRQLYRAGWRVVKVRIAPAEE